MALEPVEQTGAGAGSRGHPQPGAHTSCVPIQGPLPSENTAHKGGDLPQVAFLCRLMSSLMSWINTLTGHIMVKLKQMVPTYSLYCPGILAILTLRRYSARILVRSFLSMFFPSCLDGFSVGSPASSHSLKASKLSEGDSISLRMSAL